QRVTFTATVGATQGAGTPTGTVLFLVGNRVVGHARLDAAGQAGIKRRLAARGRLVVRAVNIGDGHFAARSQPHPVQESASGNLPARRRANGRGGRITG